LYDLNSFSLRNNSRAEGEKKMTHHHLFGSGIGEAESHKKKRKKKKRRKEEKKTRKKR
jgi:hypothetical protein